MPHPPSPRAARWAMASPWAPADPPGTPSARWPATPRAGWAARSGGFPPAALAAAPIPWAPPPPLWVRFGAWRALGARPGRSAEPSAPWEPSLPRWPQPSWWARVAPSAPRAAARAAQRASSWAQTILGQTRASEAGSPRRTGPPRSPRDPRGWAPTSPPRMPRTPAPATWGKVRLSGQRHHPGTPKRRSLAVKRSPREAPPPRSSAPLPQRLWKWWSLSAWAPA
mmetsp:Transcript_89246/g.213111  ORF Transcript_89246/g.213111 Transcript_89246/m.213111 type:complete len:225 (-) Transcript_89246:1395-2069(-)